MPAEHRTSTATGPEQVREHSVEPADVPAQRDTQLPPQVHMPLLDYVTSHSMDADYAHVAERADGRPEPASTRRGVAALVVMGLFGALVATAAVQTARNAGDSAAGRDSLVAQIKQRSTQVDARRERINNLREENAALESLFLDTTSQGRALSARLDRLGVLSGATAVTGPGVKVVVDDAPDAISDKQRVLDEDLQKLVNALWASGAEAISINGQRLSNLSAIRFAGSAITVNFVSLSRPYTVLAVGDPDTMPARFVDTEHGRDWLDLHAVYGLEFDMSAEDSMTLPAAPTRRLSLRNATQGETP